MSTEEKLNSVFNKIADDVYNGKNVINKEYVDVIGELLTDAIYSSFNFDGDFSNPDFDTKDLDILKALKKNTYEWVGAKNIALNKTLQSLILDDNDNILPFTEFKKEATKAGLLFNRTYLKTEYNTAILQSQNIVDWNSFDEQDMLQFSAVIDNHTADLDRKLNGTTLPKNDPFWKYATPQLHYNCRCRLIAVNDLLPSSLSKKKRDEIKKQIPKEFRYNAGLTNDIFPDNHPYWKAVDGKQKKEIEKLN